MTIKNGNLPAMPVTMTDAMVRAISIGKSDMVEGISGLTKREYFAALAMQSVSAKAGWHVSPSEISAESVKLADALLAELENSK